MTEVTVRVYGPLNDFLPSHRRQLSWRRLINGHTSVKDLIESLGVPHPEIDLILVNGMSVAFDYIVRTGDRIAVLPRFVTVDIGMLTRVRPRPLETIGSWRTFTWAHCRGICASPRSIPPIAMTRTMPC